MMKRYMWSACLVAFAAGVHADDIHRHGLAQAETHPVQVHQPFVRLLPPTQPNTAAFMVLENTSARNLALLRADSEASRVVELHDHQMVDGMMQMREVQRIDLPAGARTELKPGGLHVMLIGLREPLQEEQQVPITLIFDDGSRLEIRAPVRHPASESPMHHHGHRH
jgi:periplasmic copper chaperone A